METLSDKTIATLKTLANLVERGDGINGGAIIGPTALNKVLRTPLGQGRRQRKTPGAQGEASRPFF